MIRSDGKIRPWYHEQNPDRYCDEHTIVWQYDEAEFRPSNYVVPGQCKVCGREFEASFLYQGIFDVDAQEYVYQP